VDGFSRYIVNWDIRESMTEADIEIILQGAKEKHPEARPQIISDNGPQFIAKGFKEFMRISGMTHVRNSPFYPQSNGKIECWHKSPKGECIPPGTPLSLDDARRLVIGYLDHDNNFRLNSATAYITPKDMVLLGDGSVQSTSPRARRLSFPFADHTSGAWANRLHARGDTAKWPSRASGQQLNIRSSKWWRDVAS
jgi:transposase InsO family protein